MSKRNNFFGSFASFYNQGSTSFNGSNQYCIKSGFSLNGSAQGSLSVWFRTGTAQSDKYFFSMPFVSAGSNGFDIRFNFGSTSINAFVKTSGGFVDTGAIIGSFADNVWRHVAVVYNGVDVRIYVNGALINVPAALTGTLSQTANEVNIGRFGSFGAYAAGDFDEPSVWNTGLSLAQVQEIYNSGVPNNLSTHSAAANLTAWWRMYEGSTYPTINDQVGSNNLTMVNMSSANFTTAHP